MEELKIGDIIKERYELLKFLGSGSFGEVWLAHDQMTGRDVALKIYLSLDPKGVEEFQTEYANTIGLTSPYLLTPEYFDVHHRRPFLVMKYCEQGSASKLAGNISEEQLWAFIEDVAKGLEVLHGQSDPIVHQDIKPDNILIDNNGKFLITDFGISKHLRATLHRQSKRDVSSGAMPYMAPEKFDSNPKLTTASDIWSLGASIYELATGELPFSGFGGAMQRNGAEMPRLGSNFSESINDLMQRCINSSAIDRPNASELKQWAQNRTVPISQKTRMHQPGNLDVHVTTVKENEHTSLPSRHSPYWKWITISIAIMVIGGLFWLVFNNIIRNNGESNTPRDDNEVLSILSKDSVYETAEVETDTLMAKIEEVKSISQRTISISEYYYNARYNLSAHDGILHYDSIIIGQHDSDDLKYNDNIDGEKILDQFEGLAYFWAASEVGANIIDENGSVSEEYYKATLRLLKKSYSALSISRGNSPLAYNGAKSRYDMLSKINDIYSEHGRSEIEIIVWGMGEHPITSKDIKM